MKRKVLEKQVVDMETGEIKSITTSYLSGNKESFVMGRTTDGDDWIFDLTALELQLLFSLCSHKGNQKDNLVSITTGLKQELAIRSGKSVKTIDNTLNALRRKGMIKQVRRGDYLFNPTAFYTGGTNNWKAMYDEFIYAQDLKY